MKSKAFSEDELQESSKKAMARLYIEGRTILNKKQIKMLKKEDYLK